MKGLLRFLKWTGITLGTLIALLVLTVFVRWDRTFDEPYPAMHTSTDSAVIARGKYLAFGPAHCAICHTTAKDSLALLRGETVALSGGRPFFMEIGMEYTPNLTPDKETGIGSVPDSVLARTLRYGVNRHGNAILPFMPYKDMSEMDMTAVLSYLRAQAPVHNVVPRPEYNFLGKAVMAFLMKPEIPEGKPPYSVLADTTVEYGKYLAGCVANCRGCHTNRDMKTGAIIGTEYAGGLKMPCEHDAKTLLCPPNLTPDPETSAMAGWDYEHFRDRFRQGPLVSQSHMPWALFKTMNETDLKAIYKFLKSVPPTKNETGPYIQKAQS